MTTGNDIRATQRCGGDLSSIDSSCVTATYITSSTGTNRCRVPELTDIDVSCNIGTIITNSVVATEKCRSPVTMDVVAFINQ